MVYFITVKEAAALYKKSVLTIRRWCANGKHPAKKDPGGRDWLLIMQKEDPPPKGSPQVKTRRVRSQGIED